MRLRRALLITTAVSTVLLGGAQMAYAQAFDWSGFYVGVGVGAAGGFDGGELEWFDPNNDIWNLFSGGSGSPILGGGTLPDFPGQVSGFGVTGSVGFNTQMDNFLFGIEASVMSGPFEAEDTYTETGYVSSYVTSSVGTSFTVTATSSSPLTQLTTTFYSSTNTSTLSYTSTITTTVNGTTITYPTTNTLTSTLTQWVVGDTTYQSSVTFTSTTTNVTTTDTVVNTLTTGTQTYYSTITNTSTVSYSQDGSWTETITGRASIDWLATIKGRIGVTADRTLFFATGGLAIAGVSQETTAILHVDGPSGGTTTTWQGSNDETRFGFVVGGGIEQALDDHWIISGEAEYFNLGTAEYDVPVVSGGSTIYGHQTQVLDGGSVKFGIKYKF